MTDCLVCALVGFCLGASAAVLLVAFLIYAFDHPHTDDGPEVRVR